MKNSKKSLVLKIVLITWLVLSTAYVVYGEYNRLTVYVAQTSYNQGFQDSVAQLMTEASKCEPVTVTLLDNTASLINLDCLQAVDENGEQAPGENVVAPPQNVDGAVQ